MLPLLVPVDLSVDVLEHHLNLFGQTVLFVVIFVFKGQEMLVEGDAVPEQSLVAGGLVLLVNFAFLQKLDLGFVGGDLSVKVIDELEVDVSAGIFRCVSLGPCLSLLGVLLQRGVALKLLVDKLTVFLLAPSCSIYSLDR